MVAEIPFSDRCYDCQGRGGRPEINNDQWYECESCHGTGRSHAPEFDLSIMPVILSGVDTEGLPPENTYLMVSQDEWLAMRSVVRAALAFTEVREYVSFPPMCEALYACLGPFKPKEPIHGQYL